MRQNAGHSQGLFFHGTQRIIMKLIPGYKNRDSHEPKGLFIEMKLQERKQGRFLGKHAVE